MKKLIFVLAILIHGSALAEEASRLINRKEVPAETIVEKLMLNAFSYEIDLGKEHADKRYHIRFERWNLGKLVESKRTKSFEVNPDTGTDTLLIVFPAPESARMDVFMEAGFSGKQFREILPVKYNVHVDGGSAFDSIEQVPSKGNLRKEGVVLAYYAGYNNAPDDDDGKWFRDQTLEDRLIAYHKHFVKHQRGDVDVIVYRLLAE
jgi:hypothetical protein